jgi:hypothetical protein
VSDSKVSDKRHYSEAARRELAIIGVFFDIEDEPFNASARELSEQLGALRAQNRELVEALRAVSRLQGTDYTLWRYGESLDKCDHGTSKDHACRRCDQATLVAALAKAEAQEKRPSKGE